MTQSVQFTVQGRAYDGTELFQPVFAPETLQRYHPSFVKHYSGLTQPEFLAQHVRHLRLLLERAECDVRGKTVLDAGCGYGVSAILCALFGARRSYGFDFQPRALQTFAGILGALPVQLPVYPALADAATLPYADGAFDVMLTVEAISHFRRVDAFLREAARVLRTGGVLIISDANNAANWRRAWRTRRIWEAFENGPPTSDCHGHKISRSFLDKRREIIADGFPGLRDEELDSLSRGTSGLWKPEILTAVRRYVETGEHPQHVYRRGTCPLDPTIGHYGEFLFQPMALARRIEAFGFRARAISHFGGARGGAVATISRVLSWRPLTPLSIHVARAFTIVARRV
jgi:SAM-dependent methyltransferase